ncbi:MULTISPECIES: GNAT family N-acetyltransferase [Micromonospora]|uniref:GNAT family N-acetyltransferase n=1 Tax=Micromonospora sicca TaxID=2202420 RepID=A0A317DFH5_9ACTN|nr:MULTISPECIES: GNAT family N-acetyltransferase [unclassified Micromonospora]MBM0228065.1 GNAT family N-acetyltransferase [Micromonospora sp. ATA51]PWR11473.1 GNAT family N-acetyltransferase [Micromonospora sp. 4G51]
MTLPAGWTARRPTLDDVPAILKVVHAADTFAIGYPDFSAEDVAECLTAPYVDPAADSWLGLDPEGGVVAWAIVDNPTDVGREFVEVYVDPERGRELRAPLLDRQLARVAERAVERGLPALTVRCAVYEPEQEWRRTLLDAGFTLGKRYVRMSRSLADLPAGPPAPPAGVTVRPVRPDDEAELRTFHRIYDTAFRDSPDYEPRSYHVWRASLGDATDWDEWFVAEVDGEPAGVLQSSPQGVDQNEGFVKNLAVLPEHRRRGVGAALLQHAFARYAAKGRATAGLGVDLANPTAPLSLYRSVGLREVRAVDMYQLEVKAAG